MFLKNYGYIYNSTAPVGYYPSKVTATFSSGTGISGKVGVNFGTSAITTRNSGVTGSVTQSGTFEQTNTDESKRYWNFSTTGANVQVTKIEVVYSPILSDPVTYSTPTTVPYGSSFTLVNGTHFTTDGTVTLSTSNSVVATVSGLTVTPQAAGECIISVTYGAGTKYKASNSVFVFTVTQPDGETTAKPSESGLLFGESFGDNTGSARVWNNSYSVKSGVSSVYSGITGYTITNAKQSKNNSGSTLSGLMQSAQGTDASIIIGPLNVAGYSGLSLTYQWKAGSIGATYTTKAYYATSATGTYTELTGTGAGATTFVERSYTLPASAQVSTLYLKIVWNTSNTQGVIDEVQLSGSSASESVTLNANGYASFCSKYPLDFTGITDFSAWKVIGVSGTTITFAQVTGSVKGGTGLILKGEAGKTVTIPSADSSNELADNLLRGTQVSTYIEADTYFGLKGNTFVPVAESIVPAGKALLPASYVTGSEVKAFTFIFEDDDATSIETIVNGQQTTVNRQLTTDIIYNVAGQRINKMQKGLNIVNGKKVLIVK